jgi:excisionase family DNA binding protein
MGLESERILAPMSKKQKSEINPSLPDPFFVDIHEAARRLGVKVWTVRTLCWSKQIRYVRQGRRKFLFAPEDLRSYAEQLLAESDLSQ